MKYKYTSIRLINEKPRKVIVDQNGKIINNNPNKDELKDLEDERYKANRKKRYTDEELLNFLRQFYQKIGRIPAETDFNNDPIYPVCKTYQNRFGGWSNALKLAGMDTDTIVNKGILYNSNQKSRKAEMIIRDHFEKNPIDLSGDNHNSSCDGICPNGKIYEVKGSGLLEHRGSLFWVFSTNNKYKEEIEIYYFLAFNSGWTTLEHIWRVPGEIVESSMFYIGMSYARFTIENMKEYDITEKLKEIVKEPIVEQIIK